MWKLGGYFFLLLYHLSAPLSIGGKMKKRADGRYVKRVDGKFFYGSSEREVYK
jgi:hypothetical protein